MSPAPRHLVLLGLMGAGKSTVAGCLSAESGRPVTDSDAALRVQTGSTARELRARLGAEGLHALEHEHLLRSLAQSNPSIVCAAASVVDDATCRAALRCVAVLTVWLDVDPVRLAARFEGDGHRPAYGTDTVEFLTAQRDRRASAFREVADLRIDPGGRTPSDIAIEILEVAGMSGSMMG